VKRLALAFMVLAVACKPPKVYPSPPAVEPPPEPKPAPPDVSAEEQARRAAEREAAEAQRKAAEPEIRALPPPPPPPVVAPPRVKVRQPVTQFGASQHPDLYLTAYAPDYLRLGQKDRITVDIGWELPPATPDQKLADKVDWAERYAVEAYADSARLSIQPVSQDVQDIPPRSSPAHWYFEIEPLKRGSIEVSIRLREYRSATSAGVKVGEKRFWVYAKRGTWGYYLGLFYTLMNGLPGIITAVVGVLGAWLGVQTWRKNQAAPKHKKRA
jgi:hypothetical protein